MSADRALISHRAIPPASLGTIAARVDARLDELLAGERTRWVDVDPDLAVPVDEIRRMVQSGGKRLRPAFCYWAFVGAGGERGDQRVFDAGAALELIHASALFHDDVIDDAASRRGAPTTHTRHAERHRAGGWLGESRRFGDGVAILAGDLALVLSDDLMVGVPDGVWRLWNELRLELNVGQFLDVLGSVQRDRSLEKAERIARYKSGKYTIERPLHIGALLAGRQLDDELCAMLSAFGLPLGDAFQMRDDVIGAFGDPAITGKPVGDDLRQGKPTWLLAAAVGRATRDQLAVLDQVGEPDLDAAGVAAIQQVVVDTGALAAVEQRIAALAAEAVAALAASTLGEPAVNELVALADYVVARRA
jgi:geranylgeranyl diphosphate synthase type I